jgi:hypothetical protein
MDHCWYWTIHATSGGGQKHINPKYTGPRCRPLFKVLFRIRLTVNENGNLPKIFGKWLAEKYLPKFRKMETYQIPTENGKFRKVVCEPLFQMFRIRWLNENGNLPKRIFRKMETYQYLPKIVNFGEVVYRLLSFRCFGYVWLNEMEAESFRKMVNFGKSKWAWRCILTDNMNKMAVRRAYIAGEIIKKS